MSGKLKLTLSVLLISIIFILQGTVLAQTRVKDSDLDGLTDEAEVTTYKTDPLKFDTDSDGFSDGVEVLYKSDPLDTNNVPGQTSQLAAKRLLPENAPIVWYLTRITGILAFIVLTVLVTFGLVMTSKAILKLKFLAAINTLEFHRTLAWTGMLLVVAHFSTLFFDSFVQIKITELLLPFTFYRELTSALNVNLSAPVIIGIFSFYMMLLLIITSELRKKIVNIKVWRVIHYSSFLTYLLFLGHGIFSGTDSREPWMILIYLGSFTWVVGWIVLRIFKKEFFYPPVVSKLA